MDEYGVLHIVPQTILPIQFAQSKRRINRLLKSYGFSNPDFVLVDQPLYSGLVRSLVGKTRIIYRPTDEYPTGQASTRQRRILKWTDGIVATSRPVYEALSPIRLPSTPGIVIENGVEYRRFQLEETGKRDGYVYVGAMDHRFDWQVIERIANYDPGKTINLYGPRPANAPELPVNVVLHGPIEYEAVPAVLAKHQVGLLPFNDSVQNIGRSPMKYYEYLAAGLNVLGSSTPELRARPRSGVFLYMNDTDLVAHLETIHSCSGPNLLGATEAAEYDWSNIVSKLVDFLTGIRR